MNKNNLLYLVFHDVDMHHGIGKKILSQAVAFSNVGFNVFFSKLDINSYGDVESLSANGDLIQNYIFRNKLFNRLEWRLRYKNLFKYIVDNRINLLYIRYTHFANPFFIAFLKALKRKNIFVIIEIPTYPYDGEYKNAKIPIKILKFIERISRKKFKDCVDLIVNYSSDEKIFNVDTLGICNGVDFKSVNLKRVKQVDVGDITLIAVASMEDWHGYDRIIEGLNNYYKNKPIRKVYLNLIGDSSNSVSNFYRRLVKEYELDEYVRFHGFKYGEDLSDIFDESDIGVGCLGVHRKGLVNVKSLKNSEYCARGIPFLYSEDDSTFDGQPFVLKFSANNDPVDIDKVINFIDSLEIDAVHIRNYAESFLSWDNQIGKIKEKYCNLND